MIDRQHTQEKLKALFQKHMYGRYPEVRAKISAKVLHEDEKAFGGAGTLREVELSVGIKDCPPMYLLMVIVTKWSGTDFALNNPITSAIIRMDPFNDRDPVNQTSS